LKDPNPDVRAKAAQALGQICTLRFSKALQGAVRDEDSRVRAQAASALGRVGEAEAIIPLRAMAARDPVYQNRRVARQALEEVRKRSAPEEEKRRQTRVELTEALLDVHRTREERERIKGCLIRIGDDSLVPILGEALRETNDVKIHLDIVEILATLPFSKRLQAVLIGRIRHISPPVRRRAIVALGNIGDLEAIHPLDVAAREGEDPTTVLQPEDSRLALEAIQKIKRRARERTGLA
jgi:HEAT repeat protein